MEDQRQTIETKPFGNDDIDRMINNSIRRPRRRKKTTRRRKRVRRNNLLKNSDVAVASSTVTSDSTHSDVAVGSSTVASDSTHSYTTTHSSTKREREDDDDNHMPLPDDDYDDDDKDETSLELDHSTAPPAAKRAREDLSVPVQEHPQDFQQKVASLKQEVANLEKQLEEKKQELAQLLSQATTNTANSQTEPQPVEPPEEEDKEEVVDLPPDEDSDEDEDPDGDENPTEVQLDVDSKPGKKWMNQPDFLLKKPDFKITDKMIEADLKRLKEIDFHPEGEFMKDHWEALREIAQKGLEMLKDQQPEKRSKFLVWFEGKCQRHDGGTYYEGKGGAFRQMVDFVMSKIVQKHSNAIHVVHDTQQHCSKDRNPFQEKMKCCVTYNKSQLWKLVPLYEMIFQAVQHIPIVLISIGGMLSNDLIKRIHLKSCIKDVFEDSFHPRMAYMSLKGYGSSKYQAYNTTVRYECLQEFLEVCNLIHKGDLLDQIPWGNFRFLAPSSKRFKIEVEDFPDRNWNGGFQCQSTNVNRARKTVQRDLSYSKEPIYTLPKVMVVGEQKVVVAGEGKAKRKVVGEQKVVVAGKNNAPWLEQFEELKKIKNETGNFFVPKNHPANPSLRKWVNEQRSAYIKWKKGKKGTGMTDERIELLKSIGFITDQGHLAVAPCIQRPLSIHDV